VSYNTPLTSTTEFGSMKVGSNLSVVDGVVSAVPLSSSSSVTADTPIVTTAIDGTVIVDSMSIIPGAGNYLVLFNADYSIDSDSTTEKAAADTLDLYFSLTNLASTGTHGPAFGSETITAGVYDVTGAATITGILTLDGLGDPNALFVFRISAAFSTAAAASIVLINSASAANVFWVCEGAASTGAGTIFEGTILANNGAASTGATNTINGRLLSTIGAIAITTSTITSPGPSTVVNVGLLSTFALFTVAGAVGNTGVSTINGDIGTNLGAVTGFGTATVNGTIYTTDSISASVDLDVYVNSVLIATSTRNITSVSSVSSQIIPLQAIATVLAGETIDVRSTVQIGTLTITGRILTLVKIT